MSFTPAPDDYMFIPETDPRLTRIQYTGSLPSGLNGQYTLVLHVEDTQETLGGDTASIRVRVTP